MIHQKSDENDARQVAENFLQNAGIRRECLNIFATSIIHAHSINQTSWSTTIYPSGQPAIRLTVGMIYVCNISPNSIGLTLYAPEQNIALLKPFLDPANILGLESVQQGSQAPVPTAPHFVSLPEAVWCWFDATDITAVWPLVRKAYNRTIAEALLTSLNPGSRNAYASGIVKYLRATLGIHVPDPVHPIPQGKTKKKARLSFEVRSSFILKVLQEIEQRDREVYRDM